MRPSTKSLSPFLQYFSTTSASPVPLVFHTTHRCHSVFSCFSPFAEFHVRLVASENVATRLPPVVDLTSGSLPRFPISITLFRLLLTVPPGESSFPAENIIGGGQTPGKPTISAVSKTARTSCLITFGDFQNPSHHQRVFNGSSVVILAATNLSEAARAVQPARGGVRIANLQISRLDASPSEIDKQNVEHLSGKSLPS